MYYVFLDESRPAPTTVRMAAWAVPQNHWNRPQPSILRTPVIDHITEMFENRDAWAVATTTSLGADLYRPGEVDATSDVPSMSRTDNIWSVCAIFTVAAVLARSLAYRQTIKTVDVHYDSKDLKTEHRDAVQRTLREQIPRVAQTFGLLKNLNVRYIQPVLKADHRASRDEFLLGTWIADKLCSTEVEHPRMKKIDMSDIVRRSVQRWDGISFYASQKAAELLREWGLAVGGSSAHAVSGHLTTEVGTLAFEMSRRLKG